ncbi:MAG: 50S ribosomal protein L3 [candidate division TM6 bacterium GW2011_GWF2_43_17]|nr:MAG: 50S ribosomal protein L3 [candidate division TM6 bacterium GW2011_GWF2_43_17]HAU30144.1 50S ribosomal protein L3 [Candidatus Dependentiae bacterium]
MISGLWGKKIGMSQIFQEDGRVVPVTAVDVSHWYVTQVKTADRDGYVAVQVGLLRPRHQGKDFSREWLKSLSKYFAALREVRVNGDEVFEVGSSIDVAKVLSSGDALDVIGTTIGKGFQGVVKRYGHSGGRASHGDKLGRGPGSLEGMRRSGRVRKGRKLPGHMGVARQTIRNLRVVAIDQDVNVVFVKGSLPGKADSLVFMRKSE